jgi:hypothetical protein
MTVDWEDVDLDGSIQSLGDALCSFAREQIDYSAVAEAIMRLRGKWNPDDSLPEAI